MYNSFSLYKHSLVLDTVHLRERGSGFGKEEPLAEAFDRLLRAEYKGELAVQFLQRDRTAAEKTFAAEGERPL